MELKRLVDDEQDNNNKRKNIALKATNIKDIESEDGGCQSEINKYQKLVLQKFKEFSSHKKPISCF